MKKLLKSTAGFSLIELLLVIAIFSILFSASAVVFGNLVSQQSLRVEGEKVVQALRDARTYAVTQRLDSAWGIYFDSVSDPKTFTLFKGSSYAGRETSHDQVNALPLRVAYQAFNLGGGSEIVFAKRTGSASVSGNLELTADSEVLIVYINSLGFIDYVSPEL